MVGANGSKIVIKRIFPKVFRGGGGVTTLHKEQIVRALRVGAAEFVSPKKLTHL